MCGIAGVLFKHQGSHEIGKTLIEMLDGCQHRGPDSTGFALYGEKKAELQLRFIVPVEDQARREAIDNIGILLARHGASIVSEQSVGCSYQIGVKFEGDLLEFTKDIEDHAKLVSVGHTLDIIKDDGTAHELDQTYHVGQVKGTHGIGHVRLATESAVRPEAAHPFWATGFEDIAIVHNGQITNYWKMRRRLERRGFTFHTDNDSELVAVYLADKLEQGESLSSVLETAIEDLDGTFSFLVSTPNEIGYAKDNLAAKPMVLYETDDMIAIASEEVSLNRLFPGQSINSSEPAPGTFQTWSRSI
ncbi:MAG: class II glutamine amidotransferase [Gammaproteobacteria bacterium]|nr:class II glutamine amidotransferase [Gammaproteobacteria bacterium]MDH3448905.1 class II glutamine amidotransferase [Gammaproteobacteria bacterium]